MKVTTIGTAFAVAAGVSAQSAMTSPSISYVYTYVDDCSTTSSGEPTVTGTMTSTYCGECESSSFIAAGGTYTTYTTVYKELCPTGLQEKTYTVTESCSGPHPAPEATRPADYVPQGFTVTTETCHVCGATPMVATLTTPMATPTAGAAPANAAPAETGGSSPAAPGGSSPADVAAPGSGAGGSSPAGKSSPGSGGSSPAGESSPGSGGSSPAGQSSPDSSEPPAGAAPASGSATEAPYAAPGRYAAAPSGSGAPASGSSGNSSAPITPFTGAAASISRGLTSMLGAMGFTAAMAFAL